MFKTIRNVIKLVRLLSRLEWQEDTNSQTLKLGRLELRITSSDTIIKIDGVARFDTDYLLLMCPPDLDPHKQPDFLETFKHYGDDQRPGLCGCRDNHAGKEARHDKRGVC